jgi:hypothetical protein
MTTTASLTEQNRAVVEAMYRAIGQGDFEGLLAQMADDLVIDEPLYLPYGKVYRGKAELAGLFEKIGQYFDASQVQVKYMIADGDRVAACLTAPDATSGKPVEMLEQSTLRDGKIVEVKLFYDDTGTMMDKPKIV